MYVFAVLSGGNDPASAAAAAAANMLMYDPATFGTPLPMLQIPAAAIHSIQSKLATAGCLITRYTQDCRDLDPKTMPHVREVMLDVGYICRKCQMVFPVKDACVNHQQMFCYQGKNVLEQKAIIKLEQIQYQCDLKGCPASKDEKFSTLSQVQDHLQSQTHKEAFKNASGGESSATTTTPVNSSPAPETTSPTATSIPSTPTKPQTPVEATPVVESSPCSSTPAAAETTGTENTQQENKEEEESKAGDN